MNINSFRFSSFLLAFVFVASLGLFAGCSGDVDKLKSQIKEKDGEIASLTKQVEYYTTENDSFTTEDSIVVTVNGGKVEEKADKIIIHSLRDKLGFSVWEKEESGKAKVIVSAENSITIDKADITKNVTYTAKYNCLGVMLVNKELTISGSTKISQLNLQQSDILFKSYYEFTLNGQAQTQNAQHSVSPNGIIPSIIAVDENDNLMDCYKVSTNMPTITIVKIYLPDNVDPYTKVVHEPDIETGMTIVPEDLLDEEGNQQRTFDNGDALVFAMQTVNLLSNSTASVCVSYGNQASGESNKAERISILINRS